MPTDAIVLIASHLDDFRTPLLVDAVDSAASWVKPNRILVSASGAQPPDLAEFGADVWYQGRQLVTQFDHLEFLVEQLDGVDPNTAIVFMDDDDLFLPNAYQAVRRGGRHIGQLISSNDVMDAYRYLAMDSEMRRIYRTNKYDYVLATRFGKPMTIDLPAAVEEMYRKDIIYEQDFPGTVVPLRDVRYYFDHRDEYRDITDKLDVNQEDVIFMQDYLDAFDTSKTVEPYLFHRLHGESRYWE